MLSINFLIFNTVGQKTCVNGSESLIVAKLLKYCKRANRFKLLVIAQFSSNPAKRDLMSSDLRIPGSIHQYLKQIVKPWTFKDFDSLLNYE